VGIHAMSGIDIALWDIKGKALGLPIWKLLGGGFHQKIRCYASVLFGATPAETGALASRLKDRGFTAVKFGWDPMGRDAETDVALVREARKGLGKSPDLMIDAGLVWDAKTALQRARAFSEHNIFWLEEPLRPDDSEGYRRLSEATEVRIAAGEEESNRGSFLELMDKGKIDIVQVDLTRCGGFTEARKIASLAEDRGLPCVNHGFTTYINIAAALHFLNSIPNSFIMEYVAEEETTLRDHLTYDFCERRRCPSPKHQGWVWSSTRWHSEIPGDVGLVSMVRSVAFIDVPGAQGMREDYRRRQSQYATAHRKREAADSFTRCRFGRRNANATPATNPPK
jgi:L-alanine-DL-glutamate epimerase-like enolase superfamily enzyme